MRGLITDAVSPSPIAAGLPAMFDDDDFAQRLTASLDEVVAPVHGALDCLPAYLDPMLAPPDFLLWLAGWVGVEDADEIDTEALRRIVRTAAAGYAWRGTRSGLVEEIAQAAGVPPDDVTVEETGGVAWSQTPGGAAPGDPRASVVVHVPEGADISSARTAAAMAAPVHLNVRVETEHR